MKIIRKKWNKDSLIEFLGIKKLFDENPKCQVLCRDDGCLFEIELRECNLSYTDIGEGESVWEAYWTCECPVCGEEIILTKRDFRLGNHT